LNPPPTSLEARACGRRVAQVQGLTRRSGQPCAARQIQSDHAFPFAVRGQRVAPGQRELRMAAALLLCSGSPSPNSTSGRARGVLAEIRPGGRRAGEEIRVRAVEIVRETELGEIGVLEKCALEDTMESIPVTYHMMA
jgi:hypothetical protein